MYYDLGGIVFMMAACFAIIVVVLISSFMCVRAGQKKIGISILPIALVPMGHMIGSQILIRLRNSSIVSPTVAMSIVTAVDVAALVAGIAVIIAICQSCFKRKSSKRFYCTVLAIFMSVLTFVLLVNFYSGLI